MHKLKRTSIILWFVIGLFIVLNAIFGILDLGKYNCLTLSIVSIQEYDQGYDVSQLFQITKQQCQEEELFLWCINWKILFEKLVYHSHNFGDEEFMTHKLQIINKQNNLDLIRSSIIWNDSNYTGYCRPYLYTHVAFLGTPEIKLFEQNTSQSGNTIALETVSMLRNFSGLQIDISDYFNDDVASNYHQSNQNLDKLRQKYSLFNTNIIRNDTKRKQLFDNHFIPLWKFGSVAVFAEPIDIETVEHIERSIKLAIETDMNISHVFDEYPYFVSKYMYIEISVMFGWDYASYNDTIAVTNRLNKFLCVFNDATTIFAQYHYFDRSVMLIQCNITNQLELKYKIYQQALKKFTNLESQHWSHTNKNDLFLTQIGLTLFGIFPKGSKNHLFHEFAVATNVQLPVCSYIQMNRKPKIYESELEYHFNSNNNNSSLHSSIKFYNKNQYQHQHKIKYFLSGVTVIHPARKSGQMDMLILQWLDYHLFQGFDHFFLYDHLHSRNPTNVAFFYDLLLKNYIQQGYVTLIEWPFVKREHDMWNFEQAAYFDSFRRFGFDTKFIYTGDCDEFLIPKPNRTINIQIRPNKVSSSDNDDDINDENKSKSSFVSFDKHFADATYPTINPSEMINVKEIVNAILKIEKYNGIEVFTYPAMPSVYNFWINGKLNYNEKQLGCDKLDKQNRFDTFFERQSCLHYKGTSSMQNYQKLVATNDHGHHHKHSRITRKKGQDKTARQTLDQMYRVKSGLTKTNAYEVNPKMIIEAKNVLFGFFHRYYMSRSRRVRATSDDEFDIKFKTHKYKNNVSIVTNWTIQYDMFVVHTRDHWNRINKARLIGSDKTKISLFEFDNVDDIKYFYSFTQNDCHLQNIILYWNEQFLRSKFGQKWKNKTYIDPLVAKNGLFCYLKN